MCSASSPPPASGSTDADMVRGLADRVIEALRNAIDDRPADPRLLAVGLLAVQARMSVVDSVLSNGSFRAQLRQTTLAAIEPISGLHQAIEHYYEERLKEQRKSGFFFDND